MIVLTKFGINSYSSISQDILEPTPVQNDVIPRLLSRENIVMAASTGSGKTLAYALPTVQHLVGEELVGYKRLPQRPRCLVLVPTRELAKQVLHSIKQLAHFSKVSSTAIFGGEEYGAQKKMVKLSFAPIFITVYLTIFESVRSLGRHCCRITRTANAT